MKILKFLFFWVMVLFSASLNAQDKGDIKIGISVGPSFANFLFSEAPHKINIYGSDEYPAIIFGDVKNSTNYVDYNPGLIEDILFRTSIGVDFEYFLSNKLSILSGLSFEGKGKNLEHYHSSIEYSINNEKILKEESLDIKILNNYLILPIAIRKYVTENNFCFIEGGLYAGYLLSSEVDVLGMKRTEVDGETVSFYEWWIDKEKDTKKEFTTNLDFGVKLGFGIEKSITEKLIFSCKLNCNVGLRKIDAKYDNEYEENFIPGGSTLRSTNYHGFNSNSKNINVVFSLGVSYLL